MSLEMKTLAQRPDLEEPVHRLSGESWPTFLLLSDITHWGSLFDEFVEYQILFCEPAGTLIAVGHTIPFVWNGTSDDLPSTMAELMDRGVRTRRDRSTPNARYVGWKRDDGAPFDPWLRVHHRLGAEFLKLMPRSLVVAGTARK